MKFVFTDKRTVTWPVEVKVPANGGRYQAQTFDMTFEILDQSAYDELVRENMETADVAVLKRVVIGWTIEGDDGEKLPCTDETKIAVFGVPYVRTAAMQTYLKAVTGGRVKN